MIAFNYVLYYLIILPISLLPFGVLYFISDVLYYVLYKLIGYRKKVVFDNLRKSFPNKSEKEIEKIGALFYKHLCDLIVESIKIFTISEEEVRKRMFVINPELADKYFHQNKSIIMAGGHYNNWELFAVAIDATIEHKSVAIYKPLSSKFFDQAMRKTRGKYGLQMISTKKVKDFFEALTEPSATIFAIDQSPSNPYSAHWMTFLHQQTGVLFGAERYAKKYNLPVLFGHIHKIKRGYYTVDFSLLTDNPAATDHGVITEKLMRLIEEDILKQPEYWLWSHKRWKHKKPEQASNQSYSN